MRNAAKGLAGVVALAFLIFGLRYMFAPAGVVETLGFEEATTLGLASIRALLGGSFLTFGVLIIMHVIVNENHGVMRMIVMFFLFSIIGRIISLVADGSGAEAIRNLVPVSILFILSIASLVLFLRSEEPA